MAPENVQLCVYDKSAGKASMRPGLDGPGKQVGLIKLKE